MSAADESTQRFTLTLHGPRVVYGERVAETELETELGLLKVRRILLVATDRERNARADILAPVVDHIVGHVADVRRHVPVAVARAATSLAREVEADCLVSIGGGSAVGTAKAVALETGLPILAMPTTYAGSEVTPVYGMTDDGTKRTGRSELALPRTVLLDPTLTWDLPLDLTRYSAINALAHCVSGVFATGRSPVTDLLAMEGARLLAEGLRGVAVSAHEPGARAGLSRGAFLAGTVLAHAGTSAHHTICHILGGGFDLPHAETHAAVLPAASAFLQERDPRAAEGMAAVLGASSLADGLRDLMGELGGVRRLRDIGLTRTDLSRAAGLLTATGSPTRISGMSVARASQLLEDAW